MVVVFTLLLIIAAENCIIGFNKTSYTFGEGDGHVAVCAAFLQPTNPSQVEPNVFVDLIGSTSPDTTDG